MSTDVVNDKCVVERSDQINSSKTECLCGFSARKSHLRQQEDWEENRYDVHD